MIAAAIAEDPAILSRWCDRLCLAAGVPLSGEWRGGGARLLAFAGPSFAKVDAQARAVALGRVTAVDEERPWLARGDFALVGASARGDELRLVRGRFGGRPLYYASTEGGTLACSRLGPLVAALEDSSLDADGLAATLVRGLVGDGSRTIYRSVKRVPSACVLCLGARGARGRHRLASPSTCYRTDRVEDLAHELDRLISVSAAKAAPSGSVSVFVSGGLDSSALLAHYAALAASGRVEHVQALNLRFAARGDDRPHLDRLCTHLGIGASKVEPAECSATLGASLCIDGAPGSFPTVAFDLTLGRASFALGAKVVASGVGGDDVFDGDLTVFADLGRRGRLLSAASGAARLRGWGTTTPWQRIRGLLLQPLVEPSLPRVARDILRSRRDRLLFRWAGPRLRTLLSERAVDCDHDGPDATSSEPTWLCRLARSNQFSLWKEARGQFEVATGVTRVEPYLDDDLFEFLASLRPETLLHGGWVRGLFRYAERTRLPREITWRDDKSDFEPAFVEMVRAAGGFARLRPLARAHALADLGLVDPDATAARFEELVRQPLRGHLWVELWPVLAGEAFLRFPRGDLP